MMPKQSDAQFNASCAQGLWMAQDPRPRLHRARFHVLTAYRYAARPSALGANVTAELDYRQPLPRSRYPALPLHTHATNERRPSHASSTGLILLSPFVPEGHGRWGKLENPAEILRPSRGPLNRAVREQVIVSSLAFVRASRYVRGVRPPQD